jgi:mannose-6-phosphate isomerase
MNLVVLRRGDALFAPAGVLHAYQSGLGVELMAASDNVLRGGLTPKHVDVPELLRIVDVEPGPAPIVEPAADGDHAVIRRRRPRLRAHRVELADDAVAVDLHGPAIILATRGAVRVSDHAGTDGAVAAPRRRGLRRRRRASALRGSRRGLRRPARPPLTALQEASGTATRR